jgi:hypothetical protein
MRSGERMCGGTAGGGPVSEMTPSAMRHDARWSVALSVRPLRHGAQYGSSVGADAQSLS